MLTDFPAIAEAFAARGDLAHLALLLWASGASALLYIALRELAAANRRLNDFVQELARFVRAMGDREVHRALDRDGDRF